jgi:hypothetical protein
MNLQRRQVCLKGVALALVLSFAPIGGAFAVEANEDRLIQELIAEVENMHHGIFIRNGMSYDADKAASHLRDKLAYFKNDIHTADDFIRLCATRSEMTGIRYKVKDASGVPEDAAEWLYTRLTKLRAEQRSGPSATVEAQAK